MFYNFLADAVLVLHAFFVGWVVFGALAGFWRRWLIVLHLPALAWGGLVAGMGWICPLTPLENDLRMRAGLAPYPGDFIHHYLMPLLYPPGLTRPIQILLAALLVGGNILIYALLFRRRGAHPASGERSRNRPPASRSKDRSRT